MHHILTIKCLFQLSKLFFSHSILKLRSLLKKSHTTFRKNLNNMNFPFFPVLQYKKHQYQEGTENDCKFLCKDGAVFGGCTVLSFTSRFMEMAIIKEREKQTGEERKLNKVVELDFKLYATRTIKVNLKTKIVKMFPGRFLTLVFGLKCHIRLEVI